MQILGDFPSGHPLGFFPSIGVSGTTHDIRISPYHNIIPSTKRHTRTAFRYRSIIRTDLPYTVGVSCTALVLTRILLITPLSVVLPRYQVWIEGDYLLLGRFIRWCGGRTWLPSISDPRPVIPGSHGVGSKIYPLGSSEYPPWNVIYNRRIKYM